MIAGLIERIKQNEGYSETVYKCTAGYDTIGYGFDIKDFKLSEEISTTILTELIENKLNHLEKRLDWFRDMPPEVQGIICEMVFQIGFSGFCKFKRAIAHFKEKEFKHASEEMLDSKWAKKDSPQRAKRLAKVVWNHG